jgi:hypothetical protein
LLCLSSFRASPSVLSSTSLRRSCSQPGLYRNGVSCFSALALPYSATFPDRYFTLFLHHVSRHIYDHATSLVEVRSRLAHASESPTGRISRIAYPLSQNNSTIYFQDELWTTERHILYGSEALGGCSMHKPRTQDWHLTPSFPRLPLTTIHTSITWRLRTTRVCMPRGVLALP